MMKTTMTPIRMFRLTLQLRNRDGTVTPASRRVTKASQAAEFYTSMKSMEWWSLRGSSCPVLPNNPQGLPDRYERLHSYQDRLLRRVLPIFQRMLP